MTFLNKRLFLIRFFTKPFFFFFIVFKKKALCNNKNPWKLRVSIGAFLDRGLFRKKPFFRKGPFRKKIKKKRYLFTRMDKVKKNKRPQMQGSIYTSS